MNRAMRIYEILKDGREHCTHDIWREMGTAPPRAKYELEKQGTKVETVRMCRHNGANYAVYRLVSSREKDEEYQSIYSPLEPRKEQNALFEIKNSL